MPRSSYGFRTRVAVVGRGPDRADHPIRGERPATLQGPNAALLVTGLEGASGSTIGPGRALYVTEGAAGRISRVDPKTGDVTTFASGLPTSIVGIGGAIDGRQS